MLVLACTPEQAESEPPVCEGATCGTGGLFSGTGGGIGQGGAPRASGGLANSGGTAISSNGGNVSSNGGNVSSSGGNVSSNGGVNSSTGGASSSTGGDPSSSGGSSSSTGGAPNTGGLPSNTGGAPDTGGSPGTGGAPVPTYTLVVDAPADNSTVQGNVSVRGHAPGFLNVEVWDATHTNPPLARATPAGDGSFTTTVNASSLLNGATTWTVYAWDSPPGQSFTNTDNVALHLTIAGGADPCSGQTCSGHGTCSVSGGQASCACSAGYHAVGLTCVADSTGGGTPDPGTAYVPSGYKLTFSDEFSGSSVDKGKWNTLAPYGVQFYSDSHQKQAFIPDQVSLAGGLAVFTAIRSKGNTNGQPYASGSLTTNGTFTHGYFEARTRVPAGKGFWPAFWLTSSSRWPPEWDIFEIINGDIFGYTHPVQGGLCSFVDGAAGSDSIHRIQNLYGVYHVYGFHWTASDLYWYVDGVMTEHYRVNAAAGANDPFWLNISLQVGGDWPGDPDGTTPFPSTMEVDYVRIYQP